MGCDSIKLPVGPEFFYGQDTGSGIDAPVQSYDLNKYLASLYSVNATNGQTTDSTSADPTNPSGGWNGEIGAITQQATVTDQRNAIGSLGTQANKSLAQSSDGNDQAPSWAQKKNYLDDTGSTAAGALPPVP